MLLSSISYAGKQIRKYQFEQPQILQQGEFVELKYKDCQNFGFEGDPMMPMFNVNLLVPQGEVISAVNIIDVIMWEETQELNIKPAPKPFPISKPAKNYIVTPNNDIYLSDAAYPQNNIDHINTGFLAGHSIGTFTICPVEWNPASKTTSFIKEIIVEVVTEKDSKASEISLNAKNNTVVNSRLHALVENPEALETYNYYETKDGEETDLLIITSETLQADFESYATFKQSLGFYTEVVTVEDIYTNYEGQDNQEKIRNCIIDYYTNHNLQFVILGGDSDPNQSNHYIVPHRGMFAQDEWDIPSDIYYCCLDGSWNNDGDNKWGEENETDLFAEVLIGRFCVDNADEINNLSQKNIKYQTAPVLEDLEKALMLGERLDDNPTYGGNYKDEIMNGSSANGYTTTGFSDNFVVETIYDRDQSWNKYTIFDKFNNDGIHLMNHLGHSFTDYNMKMYCSDITLSNFTNDGETRGYVIGYSQGCYNGAFDNRGTSAGNYSYTDSFAEYITNLERAEVACIANSRYGWYMPSSTNSSSQLYDREFFDALFGEDITMIGAMNADSKEDNPGIFNGSDNYRWVVYETNLFGDPTLDIWTAQPQDITASVPESVIIGSSEIEFQIGIANARIGVMQNGALIGRGVTNEDGDATVMLLAPISTTDPLSLSIIAHNYNRLEQEMLIISNQPYVIYNQHLIKDENGNNNGNADFDETVTLDMTLKNVGDQPSEEVIATLSTDDENVTITNATSNFGIFASGEIKTLEDAFEITIADAIEDGHTVLFNLSATDASETWGSKMYITLNAPILQYSGTVISDPEGNGNGLLDPGETLDIIFTIQNTGHADYLNAAATISCDSDFITINEGATTDIEVIEAEGQVTVTLNVTIDEDTPSGTRANFNCSLDAAAYSTERTIEKKIGIVVENFETGDFSAFDWVLSGGEHWEIVADEVGEGQYAARSGAIGNSALTLMQIPDMEVLTADSIAFMFKVSSEQNADNLLFYTNGTLLGEWSGEQDWKRVSFPIEPGNYTFRWLYKKDNDGTGGQDCAWVDFIELPVTDFGVGIEELAGELIATAMPNPATEMLAIRIDNPATQNISIELRALNGQNFSQVLNQKMVTAGVHVFDADVRNLQGGVYILTIRSEQSSITKKVIIQ